MTTREATREAWRNLKGKPLKDKLVHIGTYYWPYILVVGFLLTLSVSIIYTAVTAKDTALQGYFISTMQQEEDPGNFRQDFAAFAGIDTEKYEITLTASSYAVSGSTDMSIADSQIIASWSASEALDILGADTETLLNYAYNDYFCDLREVLTPEQLQKWETHLIYMDWAVYQQISSSDELSCELPDPAAPESMEDPIPVAIAVPESSVLWDSYTFLGESPAVGIIVNSPRREAAVRFLEYILK